MNATVAVSTSRTATGVLLWLTGLLLIRAAMAAPTIPNPSFEEGAAFTTFPGYVANNSAIIGWTVSDASHAGLNPANGSPFADNGVIPHGARVAFLQSGSGLSNTLSTTITGLTPGKHYRVHFRANQRAATSSPEVTVSIGGGLPVSFKAFPSVDPEGEIATAYYVIRTLFTATAATATLVLSNQTLTDSALLVDDFQITEAAPLVVTNAQDSGTGSLRKALSDAASSPECNFITFLPGLNNTRIALESPLVIDDASGVIIDASALREGVYLGIGVTPHRLLNVTENGLCSMRRMSFADGADEEGGGVKNQGTLLLDRCAFYNCHASNLGGGILNQGVLNMSDTEFVSCVSEEGGCFYNIGHAVLDSCLFFASQATLGAGISNGVSAGTYLEIANSTFQLNEAAKGAAINNEAKAIVTTSKFERNSTSGDGGAIFTTDDLQVSASLFDDNDSEGKGGAIYNAQTDDGTLSLMRCTLNGNSAAVSGGAIHNAVGKVDLKRCTIALNEAAQGGGLASVSNASCLTSAAACIIARNTNGQVELITGEGTNSFGNCEKNIIGVDGGSGLASFSDHLIDVSDADVGLMDLADNGGPTQTMALQATSVARNNVWLTGETAQNDQRGFPVVGTPDAGAYEVQSNGTFHFSSTVYNVEEPAGVVNVVVTRDHAFEGAAQVTLKTTPGTATTADYTPINQVLNFADGEGQKSVALVINVDLVVEKNETFKVELSSPSMGTSLSSPSSAMVVIGDPSSHVGTDNLAPPAPTVSTPVANEVVKLRAGERMIFSGTATDNKGVSQVLYRIGSSGPFSSASLETPGAATTKWSAEISIGPGMKSLEVMSQDEAANIGSVARQSFKVQRPLQVYAMGEGSGSFTTGFAGESFRDVNAQHVVTAIPSPGSLFTGWTIGVGHSAEGLNLLPGALQKPTLTFTFREHLILYANFVPNPYPSMAGDYLGLVRAPNATDRSSTEGVFSITTQGTGVFSGKLTIDGLVLNVTGAFDANGVARFGTGRTTSVMVARPGKPSLAVNLAMNLDPARSFDSMSGVVAAKSYLQSAPTVQSAFTATRAIYHAANPVPPGYLGANGATQAYTAVFPAKQQYDPVYTYVSSAQHTITLMGDGYAAGDTVLFTSSPANGPMVGATYILGPTVTYSWLYKLLDANGNEATFTGNGNCYVAINNLNPQKEGPKAIDYPQGDGFASLMVSKTGVVTLTGGKLADGTACVASAKVVAEDKFPLFVPMYGNRGWLSGEVALDRSNAESDMRAIGDKLEWLRPADYTKQHYPAGWPSVINVSFMAARYASSFSPASSILRRTDTGDADQIGDALNAEHATVGNAALSFYDGLLSSSFSKRMNISTANKVSYVPVNEVTFSLTLTPTTGGFSGKFLHELDDGDGVARPPLTDFQGMIYQKGTQAGGYGYFLSRQPTVIDYTGQSGAVTLLGR